MFNKYSYKVNKLYFAKYCTNTKAKSEKSRFSNTVLLPKTKLPVRIENKKLIERDRLLTSSDQFSNLYQWQRVNLTGVDYILHDGPPYANGVPHMGHAINKILKDVILRTKILQHNKVHYIPGWDCHGLPIELKATSNNKNLHSVAIRKKAKIFATDAIQQQKEAFQSWGIIGDWNNTYTTYHPNYVKNQLRQFHNLYLNNLIYRDVKPVYWSPSTKTALAEAELEYNPDHRSTAVILKMQLQNIPNSLNSKNPIYALIWTTTPWTLPSNEGICYNPKLHYTCVEDIQRNENYIIASNLVEEISKKLNTNFRILQSFEGDVLKKATYIHPIYRNKILNFIPANHVAESKGTGLVHTAPAHGPDDYLVALENNIAVTCMVDEDGKYTSEAGNILNNLFVLTDGTKAVINILDQNVIHIEDFVHSYPYDWRTKKPIILRASKQWFIDTNTIKQKALELVENIKIFPETYREIYYNQLKSQLQKRPYWCISRQRSWGVPIPVFYFKGNDEAMVNENTIEAYCKLIDKHGCDFWWNLEIKDILEEKLLKKYGIDANNIEKGKDILDIWFDSGLTWSSVLPEKQIADLYLEGGDQITGWFQSSLLTSVGLRNQVPYKALYIHGFAVDENGKKMSKSLGNVINPTDIITGGKKHKAFGVDTLRWWVACHANQDPIAEVSVSVLQASNDEVQKMRNVLRFAVAALSDYENANIQYSDLKIIDKYMLHLLSSYNEKVEEHLNSFQFHKINLSVIQLLTNNVSALYYTSIKDRLYCEPQDSLNRRCAQYVVDVIFKIVTRSIAPILPHLAEELYSHLTFKDTDSFFKTKKMDIPKEWHSENVFRVMTRILNFKKEINKQAGATTLTKSVTLFLSSRHYQKFLELSEDDILNELADIFQVSSVNITINDAINDDDYEINLLDTNKHSCPRCRRFSSTNDDELCSRCNVVVDDVKISVAS